MIRRPPRSTQSRSSAASDVYKRQEKGWYRLERSYGSFSRSLTLPDGVDAEKVEANFDRGVLEIRVPKPEERKPRRISIGGNGQKTIEGTTTE